VLVEHASNSVIGYVAVAAFLIEREQTAATPRARRAEQNSGDPSRQARPRPATAFSRRSCGLRALPGGASLPSMPSTTVPHLRGSRFRTAA
jgi:hypothetical protein